MSSGPQLSMPLQRKDLEMQYLFLLHRNWFTQSVSVMTSVQTARNPGCPTAFAAAIKLQNILN